MTESVPIQARSAWITRSRNVLNRSGLLVAVILLFALLSQFAPNFLSTRNIFNVLRAVANNGMIACAMTLVLISGDIDVSVGSAVAWSSSLLGVLAVRQHWPLGLAVAAVLIQGVTIHCVAALIRVKWNVPAFVVTLALYMSLRGGAKVITNTMPITPFPETFSFWGQGYIGKVIPVPAALMLITIVIFYFLSTRTVFGRSVYSVGGNEEAARLSGIPIWRTRITIFALTGLLASIAGIITTSRVMSGAYNVGEGLEFEVIAAVIMGGTSLAGGAGSMVGTFLGVLFIGLLANGMTLMGVHPYWQEVARGLIVLVAVLTSVWQRPIRK